MLKKWRFSCAVTATASPADTVKRMIHLQQHAHYLYKLTYPLPTNANEEECHMHALATSSTWHDSTYALDDLSEQAPPLWVWAKTIPKSQDVYWSVKPRSCVGTYCWTTIILFFTAVRKHWMHAEWYEGLTFEGWESVRLIGEAGHGDHKTTFNVETVLCSVLAGRITNHPIRELT